MVKKHLVSRPLAWLIFFLSGVLISFWVFDLTINFTPSMPIGIWRVSKAAVDIKSLRHQTVLFCPPDTEIFRWARTQGIVPAGRCPGNYTPLLKRVEGLPNDNVAICDGLVVLNGQALPMSKVLPLALPIPPVSDVTIPTDSIWVMGASSPESFDSRYFGVVTAEKVIGLAEPILTL